MVIRWPNAKERRNISRYFANKHGLPNAVDVVDGNTVICYQKPGEIETIKLRPQR